MKSILLLSILVTIILSSISFAQNNGVNKNKYKRHYYTKKSIYEALPNTKDEILFVGNSITAGGQWAELFSDLRVKNRGISGDVTDGILFRLEEITESNPKKIFLMIGVNDLSKGKSKNYILEKYQEIIDSIKSQTASTKIYIQSILPVNNESGYFKNHTDKTDSIISLNSSLKKIAKTNEIEYINLFVTFANSENKMKKKYSLDGLHFNGEGYLKWAELIKEYVK